MNNDCESPEKESAALRLYMDESGGEDPNTPQAVIGGMLIFRKAFHLFEDEWDRMLQDHGIPGGIHMREFGQHGRLGTISKGCRKELFLEAKYLIERYRAVTIAAALDGEQYKSHIPHVVRKKFSLYGMCFNLAVMMNHKLCERNRHSDRVPFILDAGNAYASHVRDAHEFMLQQYQKQAYIHVGSLFFEDDKALGTLQAADIIAWGTRRQLRGLRFPPGFSPIEELVAESDHHARQVYKPEWLQQIGTGLQEIINSGKGSRNVTDDDIKEGL